MIPKLAELLFGAISLKRAGLTFAFSGETLACGKSKEFFFLSGLSPVSASLPFPQSP